MASVPHLPSTDAALITQSLPCVDILRTNTDRSHKDAASSMIIQTSDKATRTIISHSGDLPEMTKEDFTDTMPRWNDVQNGDAALRLEHTRWVHFEGRIPSTTNDCISHLRGMGPGAFKISVECEKPERDALIESAKLADVIFFSKIWAEVSCI